MPALNVSHKGYNLRLVLPYNSYYATQEFEPGKTMYQILFEHLIDGTTVSQGGLVRRYKWVNIFIRRTAIKWMMGKIEAALKTSKDRRLREMRFVTLPSGGVTPVLSRKTSRPRSTVMQRPQPQPPHLKRRRMP
jgi:hypothetical protein